MVAEKLNGSCLCGSVKYFINGGVKAVANCHCKTCKKMTGAVFATIAVTAEENFHFIQGEKNLESHQVSEKGKKYYCRDCGTPIFNVVKKYPGNYMVLVGSLDEPSLVEPVINIFCESMLPWLKKMEDMKDFETEPNR